MCLWEKAGILDKLESPKKTHGLLWLQLPNRVPVVGGLGVPEGFGSLAGGPLLQWRVQDLDHRREGSRLTCRPARCLGWRRKRRRRSGGWRLWVPWWRWWPLSSLWGQRSCSHHRLRVCVSWFDRLNKGLGQPGYGRFGQTSHRAGVCPASPGVVVPAVRSAEAPGRSAAAAAGAAASPVERSLRAGHNFAFGGSADHHCSGPFSGFQEGQAGGQVRWIVKLEAQLRRKEGGKKKLQSSPVDL
ncbi:uncharacterized protein LOC120555296 [Perca fluviatilis]|uniref:uncharacterized protein LOC120555296 n=1 Tax=Perca fluviatilis TaxID=8168 RepID=UPI0019648AAE|nr:uncharacterized protein LOC120555296 [Perca fluviatilis]